MKLIAWALNLLLLALTAAEVSKRGMPRGDDYWYVVVMFAAPIASSIALWFARPARGTEESTYSLARKALRARLRRMGEAS